MKLCLGIPLTLCPSSWFASGTESKNNLIFCFASLILSQYIIRTVCVYVIISFFYGAGGIVWCSSITFDLEIFKRVPINPEMQIIDPEDCCGALRSECSFDGVKFKRIIMVLGNEYWNRSQAGSSLKCFRMPPESRGLWFHCSAGAVCVLNSYRSYYYPTKSTSLSQPLLVPLNCFSEAQKRLVLFQAPSTTIKHCYCGPQARSQNSTVSVGFNTGDQRERLWK